MWSHRWGWRLARRIVNSIFLPRYNGQRKQLGLPPLQDTMTQAWASKRLNLLAVSPAICQRPPDWPSHHVVTGFINETNPLLSRPLSQALRDFLESGEPPVFMGFGSMMMSSAANFATETIGIWQGAVRALGVRAVIQLPESLLHGVVDEKTVHAVSWADYRLLFPQCSAIVHHGGAGTTQSALHAGRPTLIVAHMSDQFFWGKELERLGVAGPTQHRKGLSTNKLCKAIRATLDNPSLASNARMLGESMSNELGVESAIAAIENTLGPR